MRPQRLRADQPEDCCEKERIALSVADLFIYGFDPQLSDSFRSLVSFAAPNMQYLRLPTAKRKVIDRG